MSRQKRRVLKAEKIQNSESAENAEVWNQTGTEKSGTRENREISVTEIHRNLAERDSKGLQRNPISSPKRQTKRWNVLLYRLKPSDMLTTVIK
jgi:hypothetical protein